MANVAGCIRKAPLVSFFVITFVFTWSLLPIAATSIPVSLIALCGPAIAACIVVSVTDRVQRREFYARMVCWRVPVRWYLLALSLPLAISAFRSGFEFILGARGEIGFQSVSVLSLIVFVLVIGEEAGWRGFALPRLLARFGRWGASLIVGVVWALWHLPLFHISSMPQFGSPFVPFIGYTIALSVILTFLSSVTGGSVVIATIFHGAVNTIGFVNSDADGAMRGWSNALSYGLAALLIGLVGWRDRVARN